MSAQPRPIDPQSPMPHRKVIREWLVPLADRSTWRAVVLLVLDYAL